MVRKALLLEGQHLIGEGGIELELASPEGMNRDPGAIALEKSDAFLRGHFDGLRDHPEPGCRSRFCDPENEVPLLGHPVFKRDDSLLIHRRSGIGGIERRGRLQGNGSLPFIKGKDLESVDVATIDRSSSGERAHLIRISKILGFGILRFALKLIRSKFFRAISTTASGGR